MCNTCNCCCGLWNLFGGCGSTFNRSSQSICRDCCGNIVVREGEGTTSCGCNACRSCDCHHGFCSHYGDGLVSTNGYGCNRSCMTVCGNALTFPQSRSGCGSSYPCVDGDAYYARQFGMMNLGRGSCSCGCST